MNNNTRIKLGLDIVEFLLIILSILISFHIISVYYSPSIKTSPSAFIIFSMFLLISWYAISRITAMAKVPRTQRYLMVIFQFLQSNVIVFFTLILIKLIFNFHSIPFLFIVAYIFFSLTATLTFRLLVYRFLQIYRSNGYNLHQVLLIADSFSDGIIERLNTQKQWGFNIMCILSKSRLIREKYGKDIHVYGEHADLKTILDTKIIDEVIYCQQDIDEARIKQIADTCSEVGVIFRMQSSISPLEDLDIQLKVLNSPGELTLVDAPSSSLSLVIKTILDFYISALGLLILSPLFLLIAVIVKLDSRGPVFFKQERIGLRGRKFSLIKFRTMVLLAEELLPELKDRNEMDGPVFKLKNDPRITRFGRFLRRSSLDELPQLYNVLLGQMSLIGPRPPLESEVRNYERWQLRRLSVKPGITCTWQVIPNRNEVKFDKWMRMDLRYIDNWSLYKDISLLFKTLVAIIFLDGR